MKSNNYPDYLWQDKKRKLRIKSAEMLRNIRIKALKSTAVLLLTSICLYLLVYPLIVSALTTEPTVEQEEEPAIEMPRLVSAQEVQIEVKIDWTEERIVEEIHKVFPDAPIMERVAKCEGTKNGRLHPEAYNPTNGSGDTGIFQISEKYHGKEYRRLGFTDMEDIKQNLAYARILYDRNGLNDWLASQHCWSRH